MAISLNFMFDIYNTNKILQIGKCISGYNIEKSHHVIVVIIIECLLGNECLGHNENLF